MKPLVRSLMRCQSITPSFRIPIGLWRTAIHVSRTLTLLLLADDDDVIIMRIYLFLHGASRLGTLLITHEVLGPATPVELDLCAVVGKCGVHLNLFIYVHRCRQAMRCCRLFMVTKTTLHPVRVISHEPYQNEF